MRWSLWAGLFLAVLPAWAQFFAPPPAIRIERDPAEVQRALEPKGTGGGPVYSIGNPTDDEQLVLELINRARANPGDEAFRLATITDPEILSAYQFFSLDLNKMFNDISAIPAVPPLAMNAKMITTARLHSDWMFVNAIQAHFETNGLKLMGPGERLTAQGYAWSTAGESVFARATSAEQAHIAFEVDWGPGLGGMQDPPGHRENNHSAAFRELGVGIHYGSNQTLLGEVGPLEVTIEFGADVNPKPFITGVAYYDLDGDHFYGVGEGLDGVSVTANGVSTSAVSAASGGYALPVDNGTYQVVFSLGNFHSTPQSVTISGGKNSKVDLVIPYVAPTVTGPAQALFGGVNVYQIAHAPIATGYYWQAALAVPYTAVEGAEPGTSNFVASVGGYSTVSTDFASTGTSSFHLVHVTQADQQIALRPELYLLPGATLTFATRFGFATPSEVARMEISTNSGQSWFSVWSQAGITKSNQTEKIFTHQSVNLSAYAGLSIQTRFRFTTSGAFYNQFKSGVGVYVDDIAFTNAELLANKVGNLATADGAAYFTPPSTGKYYVRGGTLVGTRFFPLGTALAVQSGNVAVATPVTRVVGVNMMPSIPDHPLQIDARFLSGSAMGFQLQQATDTKGPWVPVANALSASDGLGSWHYSIAVTQNRLFFRFQTQ
ncbi:MAG TPA: hypothetical protein VMF06_25320 [Candidatus Limnocylindria bacterium]|nr:hypothetical protein [Candidatus Limnocylindria bacterium]